MTKWIDDSTGKEVEVGPTGEFPEGKVREDDEGALRFAIGVTEGAKVFIEFGTEVKWMAFGPDDAIELAQSIIMNAQKAVLLKEKMRNLELVKADSKEVSS